MQAIFEKVKVGKTDIAKESIFNELLIKIQPCSQISSKVNEILNEKDNGSISLNFSTKK